MRGRGAERGGRRGAPTAQAYGCLRSRIAAELGFLDRAGVASAEMRWISRSHCAGLMLPPVAGGEDTLLARLPARLAAAAAAGLSGGWTPAGRKPMWMWL